MLRPHHAALFALEGFLAVKVVVEATLALLLGRAAAVAAAAAAGAVSAGAAAVAALLAIAVVWLTASSSGLRPVGDVEGLSLAVGPETYRIDVRRFTVALKGCCEAVRF